MTSRARAWANVTLQPRTDKPRNIHGGRVLSRQGLIAVQMTDFHIADSRRSPVIYGSTTRAPGVKFSNDFSRACVGVYSRIPNCGNIDREVWPGLSSGRVLEPMSKDEAKAMRVLKRRGIFKSFSGKLNYSPTPEDCNWYRIDSVTLDNGPQDTGGLDYGGPSGVCSTPPAPL